ncbi:MAG: homoserine dehydrogenase [Rhodospirillales bacterium]
MTDNACKVGIAGLGTVGAETVRLIAAQKDLLAARSGREIRVTAVSARDRNRDRGLDLAGIEWFGDAAEMAAKADADIVVEVIGGEDGKARETIDNAIAAGRSVVTANKAMLAHHGIAIATAAEAAGVWLGYEAAVAGGIPIIRALREGLSANRHSRVTGILNGTCNYILTEMRQTGAPFEGVLADAQKMGYAESDPTFDIDGIDAAHKLAILASLAFGVRLNFGAVHIDGIRDVSPVDIAFAEELGYRIKLLGTAKLTDAGLEQRVHPCMVPKQAPIAHVEDVFNAVVVEGDFVGQTLYEGRGAGAGPTASAVVSDIIDIAAGRAAPAFGLPVSQLVDIAPAAMAEHICSYYVRLSVVDRAGVVAEISAILRDLDVSISNLMQRARDPGEPVPLVLTTHETREASMMEALARISALDVCVMAPCMIRIESL